MFPGCETYRLYKRGEAGICCDEEGVSLGPIALVTRSGAHYFVGPEEDMRDALKAAYGPLSADRLEYLACGVVGVARSLNKGDFAIAMIKALHLRLPEIAGERLAKMERAFGKANFNSDEPRDWRGRWTADAAAAAALGRALGVARAGRHSGAGRQYAQADTGIMSDGSSSAVLSGKKVKIGGVREVAASQNVGIKAGVNIEKLRPEMAQTIGVVSSVASDLNLPRPVITSGNDSKHMTGSLHYKNSALDFRGNNITLEQGRSYRDHIQARLGKDYQVFFETFLNNPSNNHIHIEYQPRIRRTR